MAICICDEFEVDDNGVLCLACPPEDMFTFYAERGPTRQIGEGTLDTYTEGYTVIEPYADVVTVTNTSDCREMVLVIDGQPRHRLDSTRPGVVASQGGTPGRPTTNALEEFVRVDGVEYRTMSTAWTFIAGDPLTQLSRNWNDLLTIPPITLAPGQVVTVETELRFLIQGTGGPTNETTEVLYNRTDLRIIGHPTAT